MIENALCTLNTYFMGLIAIIFGGWTAFVFGQHFMSWLTLGSWVEYPISRLMIDIDLTARLSQSQETEPLIERLVQLPATLGLTIVTIVFVTLWIKACHRLEFIRFADSLDQIKRDRAGKQLV